MREEANALLPELIAWRRALHQMPETDMQLPKTMEYLLGQLENMEISCQYYREISCITATLGQGEHCVLLRADGDGLPMQEQSGLSFAAQNGCMHSCGHDLHCAMLLGAAKLLKNRENQLPGRVKLLFQSGEETFRGGEAAIRAGVLDRPSVDAALALHVVAMLPVGCVVTGKMPMAAADSFQLTLQGRGGHGSMPEQCVDPIQAAVQIHVGLQTLIARETGGTEEAVLTIGQLSAGSSPNVIPDTACLTGTLRTFQKPLRERLLRRIRELATGVAHAYRCRCSFAHLAQCPAVVTDHAVTGLALNSLRSLWPDIVVQENAHGMGSEDFAWIAERIPSAYLMLGAGPASEDRRFCQHDPRVIFSEDVLPMGAALHAKFALDQLNWQKNTKNYGKNLDKNHFAPYDNQDG